MHHSGGHIWWDGPANPTVLFGQVEELRRDLRIKSQELEAKNAAANDKLKKMVKDQQEAEKKKARRLNSDLISFP